MEKHAHETFKTQYWRRKPLELLLSSSILIATLYVLFPLWKRSSVSWMPQSSLFDVSAHDVKHMHVTRSYNLTIGVRWMNQDGGRWKPVLVCNGISPCPTLLAEEGDKVKIHVINDLGAQLSIHWSGMSHQRTGFWNDGTGGLNQYPILPRGNWTSEFDTSGHMGVNWYADHTGAGVADGIYGMIYVAPSASRPRPYSKISESPIELQLMKDAEQRMRHLALWNSDFRSVAWRFSRLQGEGTGLYCYKSLLINGKGRVHCKNPDYDTIDGQRLDETGCVLQAGFSGEDCTPSTADFEIIETNGQAYIMLNLINIGFEHAQKVSIDDHQMWVVADDAGFVEPQLVDTLYITNGARYTILVKLDREPDDYAIRFASTSKLQNLESYAILRYPAKRYPMLGFPMEIPKSASRSRICLNADGSLPDNCKELQQTLIRSYPAQSPPRKVDVTIHWKAGSQQSKYMKHITEYFVNEKPWQLFRAAMEPVFFTKNAEEVEKPVQSGLPLGTVVDLIVQNTLNETIPMYKHGSPTYHLGSRAYEKFKYSNIIEALEHKLDINTSDPPLALVHDLPPMGWLAIRWKVDVVGATMFHAVKLRYFALGMAAPLLEGIDHSVVDVIPAYAKMQPHVNFEPVNSGVFG